LLSSLRKQDPEGMMPARSAFLAKSSNRPSTIGSGGAFGKGFMQGSQAHLSFLPEKQTDFKVARWLGDRAVIAAELEPAGIPLGKMPGALTAVDRYRRWFQSDAERAQALSDLVHRVELWPDKLRLSISLAPFLGGWCLRMTLQDSLSRATFHSNCGAAVSRCGSSSKIRPNTH
jgi:hypothetical protein